MEAFQQDSGGTDLGHGCPIAASQEKFQQFNKVQAQLRAEFQNNGEGQKEPSFCQFTWKIGRHQAVEQQDILLVPCQPQTLPLAYPQGGGVQHLQENDEGTR